MNEKCRRIIYEHGEPQPVLAGDMRPCDKPLPCPDHPPSAEEERLQIIAYLEQLENKWREKGELKISEILLDEIYKIKCNGHWK